MAVTLEQVPSIVITLILAAAIFVAGFLVVSGLEDGVGSSDCAGYWNEDTNACQVSASNTTVLSSNGYAVNSTGQLQEGMYNITEYIPTLGTIIGVALILGVVIAGFYFGRGRGWL